MDSFYQDYQGYGTGQFQHNDFSQADYVPRSDFEAKIISMLEIVKMKQDVGKRQAQADAKNQQDRADFEEQQRFSFENMVHDKLTALQTQFDSLVAKHEIEEIKKKSFETMVDQLLNQIVLKVDLRGTLMETQLRTTEKSIQARLKEVIETEDQTGVVICKLVQAELTDTENSIVNRFEQRLKAYEEGFIKRFEEYTAKSTHMFEKLLHKKFEDLQCDIEAVACHARSLEYKMETKMMQLSHEIYKLQPNLHDHDSDDGWEEHKFLMDELPGYVDESSKEEATNDSLKVRGDLSSQVPFTEYENEQFLVEDIIASRENYMSDEAAQEQAMDMGGMRECDYMTCAPIIARECSSGAELPLHHEEDSLPPTILPGYSCELAYTPQVKACFGVLASSASMEKSHEGSSWEDQDSSVDCESQKGQYKKKRQRVAQVWIPRGTLEVMKVFNMTEISLGEKSCVPHKAKKRKRRRKAPNPESGIG